MEIEEAGACPGAGGAEEDEQESGAVEAVPWEEECEDEVCDDKAVNGQIMAGQQDSGLRTRDWHVKERSEGREASYEIISKDRHNLTRVIRPSQTKHVRQVMLSRNNSWKGSIVRN